jgi:signal transduction histidine kinase
VSGRVEGDAVVLAFADTGRGIPAADIPHLFERYRRVREAKRTEGTGLGLYIAKTIVDAHGGRIGVESTPGVGSTFTVVIPRGAGSELRSAPAMAPVLR